MVDKQPEDLSTALLRERDYLGTILMRCTSRREIITYEICYKLFALVNLSVPALLETHHLRRRRR